MKLVYTKGGARISGVDGHYRNPDYFQKLESGATLVLTDKVYPEIQTACEQAGVPSEIIQAGEKAAKAVSGDADKMTAAQLRDALQERGVEIPEHAKKADLIALFEQTGGAA